MSGACEVAVESLRKFSGRNEELECQAVRWIAALCGDVGNATSLYSLGACALIAQMLRRYSTQTVTVQWACSAVHLLCHQYPLSKDAFAKTDICESLSGGLVSRFKTATPTLSAALKAVRSLSSGCDEIIRKFAASNIVDEAVSSAASYRTSPYGEPIPFYTNLFVLF